MNIPKPDFLDNDASAEWERIMRENGERFSPSDLGILTAYCQSYGVTVQATRELGPVPALTVEGTKGKRIPNPLVLIRNRAAVQMMACAVQLGLTPKARANAASGKKPKSPLEALT